MSAAEEDVRPGINYARVLLGGFVAGFVFCASGLVLERMLADDFRILGNEVVLPLTASQETGLLFGLRVLFGMIVVWLYAAMRPRFGPGPKTAILAGLAVWFIYSGSFADFHLAIPLFSPAVRPRFGPGAVTARWAALVVWVFAYVPWTALILMHGWFDSRSLLVFAGWGLLEAGCAAFVGGWFYREAGDRVEKTGSEPAPTERAADSELAFD